MPQPSADREPAAAPAGAFGDASPVEVLDLLLWALLELSGAITLVPDPERGTHRVVHELGATASVLATVPCRFGDALAARLAIVAGLPVGLPGTQFGRLRVRPGAAAVGMAVTELLVAVRASPAGLEAEVHRMAEPSSAEQDAESASLAAGRGRVGMYKILGVLGQGGMGVVYLAEHVALQKRVALKALHAEDARDRRRAAQFLIEARAACRVRHPGIVDVTDFGVLGDGRAYLVMELIAWPTLLQVLSAAQGPLPTARALRIVRHVAEALAAAALHGVVHRDLTPSNIFVGDDDAIKIGDFGLARIGDGAAQSQPGATLGGTAGYMSPEQWLGETSDSRSDIYSLAIILFRLLTGQMPFPASDPLELLHSQQSDVLPEAIGPDGPVPRTLQALLERALASQPGERFQSVEELLLALREVEHSGARGGWMRWTD